MKLFQATILFVALLVSQSAWSINLSLVSSPAQATAKQVVWMRCNLEPGELALFHKGLAVHTDNAALRITAWHVDAAPALLPPQIFNRVRRAYTETIYIMLSIQSPLQGDAFEQALTSATFYLAGLVLKRSVALQWRIRPVLAMASMRLEDTAPKNRVPMLDQVSSEVSVISPAVLWKPIKPLNESFTWLDAFEHVWMHIVLLGSALNNLYLLLFFFLLMVGCFLKRYTPLRIAIIPCRGLGLQWLYAASIIGFGILFLCSAIPWAGLPLTYFLLALLLMVGEGYAFFFQPTEKLLLGRLTGVIGWLMGASVLPCLIKAILVWHGW